MKTFKKLIAGIMAIVLTISLFSSRAYAASKTKSYDYNNYHCSHTATITALSVSGSATVRYQGSGSAYLNAHITGYAYNASGQILDGYSETGGRYDNEITISGSQNYSGNASYTYATVSFCSSPTLGQKVKY